MRDCPTTVQSALSDAGLVVRQLELYGVEVHGSGQGSIRSKALVQLHGDARTAGIYSSGSSSRKDVGRICRKG